VTPKRWTVLFTASAEEQAHAVADWWEGQRPAAPTLFTDELSHSIDRLSAVPGSGAPFDSETVIGVRRVLLPRCRYHVYYTVHPVRHEVLIRAIWHASRGQGPELG
jgi:plasmid stabilization system protein ParE